MSGQRHSPATLSSGKTRYPLHMRLGGPQGRYGRVLKITPAPGIDPRTVQQVASRYTDWATPALDPNISQINPVHILASSPYLRCSLMLPFLHVRNYRAVICSEVFCYFVLTFQPILLQDHESAHHRDTETKLGSCDYTQPTPRAGQHNSRRWNVGKNKRFFILQ